VVAGPGRGVFVTLLVVTIVIWALAEVRQAVKRRPEASGAAWRDEMVLRLAIVGGALLAVGARRVVPAADIAPRALGAWLGLALLWCGVALRLWCFRSLGRYFTLTVRTSSDQPIIASGPYRVVRHPSYTGILLAVAGLGCFTGNWVSVVVLCVCVTAGLVFRISVEERALLRDVGDRYRDYAATRKRLIPFVW
jgi:protein-S-isoprenylcysteine O-methyltransferase Ste14